jgi:hypothetical protein
MTVGQVVIFEGRPSSDGSEGAAVIGGARLLNSHLKNFTHNGGAVTLLHQRHRHFAGAEARNANLLGKLLQAAFDLGLDLRGRNNDLEFVLQAFGGDFSDLHGTSRKYG